MTSLLQAIGTVGLILVTVAIALICMYLSYILGIGIVIFILVYIVYSLISIAKNHK